VANELSLDAVQKAENESPFKPFCPLGQPTMLSKKQRMLKSLAKEVFIRGGTVSSPHFLLKTLPSNDGMTHCAVSVSKKVAPTAVERNTARRRVYGVIRVLWPRIASNPRPMLIGVSVKKGGEKLGFEMLSREIETLLSRAQLLY
jgi:ribonuclease P protein component